MLFRDNLPGTLAVAPLANALRGVACDVAERDDDAFEILGIAADHLDRLAAIIDAAGMACDAARPFQSMTPTSSAALAAAIAAAAAADREMTATPFESTDAEEDDE